MCHFHKDEIVTGFFESFPPHSSMNLTRTRELKNGCHINNTGLHFTKYGIFSGSVSSQ